MDNITALVAGALLPIFVMFLFNIIKKLIEIKKLKNNTVEYIIKNENGKIDNMFTNKTVNKAIFEEYIHNEYLLEKSVKNILDKYKKSHLKFDYKEGGKYDFIGEVNGKKVGLEIKSKINLKENKYFEKYINLMDEKDIDKLIFISKTKIPNKVKNEYLNLNKDIDIINATENKILSKEITKILDKEFSNSENIKSV